MFAFAAIADRNLFSTVFVLTEGSTNKASSTKNTYPVVEVADLKLAKMTSEMFGVVNPPVSTHSFTFNGF